MRIYIMLLLIRNNLIGFITFFIGFMSLVFKWDFSELICFRLGCE